MSTTDEERRELDRGFFLRRFEDVLILEQGASPRTVEAYGRDVIRCAAFTLAEGLTDASRLHLRLLRE